MGLADWHEIDHGDAPVSRIENRFQHHGAFVVSATDTRRRVGRADAPPSMLGGAEQCSETGVAVKAGPAQPVYRAVAVGCYRRRTARQRADAGRRRLHVRFGWCDSRSLDAIAGRDSRLLLRPLLVELMQNLCNDVLRRPTHVDADRILLWVGLLQDREVTVEDAWLHRIPFTSQTTFGGILQLLICLA